MNIKVVYLFGVFLLIFLHMGGLFCSYGEPFLGSPPPEQNFLRAPMNIWYCCEQDRGMGAYAHPAKISTTRKKSKPFSKTSNPLQK